MKMTSPKKHFSLNSIPFYESAALQCEVDFATNSVVSIRSPTKDGKLKFPSHHYHHQPQHSYLHPNGPHSRHHNSNSSMTNHSSNSGGNVQATCVLNRETGVVDKLATSYGFIRTNDRQQEERLFFHFSEFNSNVNSLKVGDIVEFEESIDKKSRRRVAIDVVRLGGPGQADQEEVLPQIKEGIVVEIRNPKDSVTPASTPTSAEATLAVTPTGTDKNDSVPPGNAKKKITNSKRDENEGTSSSGFEGDGKISYTHNNEYFYLSFSGKNVKDGQKLKIGDVVHFQICTTTKTQKAWATNIILKQRKPTRVKGVISSVKDTYGFIERADLVKEIFFHFSEFPGRPEEIKEGVELEFTVQPHRNGKETAVNMKILNHGSVVFFDVGNDKLEGTVMRNVDLKHKLVDPLCGRIIYKDGLSGKHVQIPYGDRDQCDPYTLQPGDLVNFVIAVDRRDQLERAHNIRLRVRETFKVSKEKRDKGLIIAVHEHYGLIACPERAGLQICFPLTEWLEADGRPTGGEKVEFTAMPASMASTTAMAALREARDASFRGGGIDEEVAVRVRLLPVESTDYSLFHSQRMVGVVQQAPRPRSEAGLCNGKIQRQNAQSGSEGGSGSGGNNSEGDDETERDVSSPLDTVGVIIYRGAHNLKEAICYELKDVENTEDPPKANDQVEFCILECRITSTKMAVKIRVLDKGKRSSIANGLAGTPSEMAAPNSLSNIVLSSSGSVRSTTNRRVGGNLHRGWVVVLKDSFGFIETEDHSRDIYFNMSNVISAGVANKDNSNNGLPVTLGCEVEYQLRRHKISTPSTSEASTNATTPGDAPSNETGTADVVKVYADCVRVLESGTMTRAEVEADTRRGRILRPARQGGAGDEEATYFGLVEDKDTGRPYPYTLTSQVDMRLHLQEGDEVKFQVGKLPANRGERAVNMQSLKPPLRARVDSVKEEGQFGFLVFDVNSLKQKEKEKEKESAAGESSEGDCVQETQNSSTEAVPVQTTTTPSGKRHLFFHMSDVINGEKVSPGDVVDFHVVCNPKTGKYSAVTIRKIEDCPVMRSNRAGDRPERLKMRSACEDSGPRLVLIRQPRGPDGTKGFTTSRDSWRASTLLATTPSVATPTTSSEGGAEE